MSTAALWRIRIDRPPPPEVTVPDDVELTDDLAEADGVVVGASEPWDASVCGRLPRLKVVVRAGIGYDNVDPASCASVGVAACNTPDAPTVSTAEHTLALLLAVSKRIKPAEHRLHAGLGNYQATHQALELEGRTLGLLGGGRIGSRVARYGAALGMRVLVCDPYLDASVLAGVAESVDLDELWRASDVVSLHAPATDATRHIVDAVTISAMKRGVVVVNCARGSLIDHDALLAGLESGHIAGAGLDVTEPEPLPWLECPEGKSRETSAIPRQPPFRSKSQSTSQISANSPTAAISTRPARRTAASMSSDSGRAPLHRKGRSSATPS